MTAKDEEIEKLKEEARYWKEKAAELEMAPLPPEVKVEVELSEEERIALKVAKAVAKLQEGMVADAQEANKAYNKRFFDLAEQKNELLAKIVKFLDPEETMGVGYELMRIKQALQTLAGHLSGESFD